MTSVFISEPPFLDDSETINLPSRVKVPLLRPYSQSSWLALNTAKTYVQTQDTQMNARRTRLPYVDVLGTV